MAVAVELITILIIYIIVTNNWLSVDPSIIRLSVTVSAPVLHFPISTACRTVFFLSFYGSAHGLMVEEHETIKVSTRTTVERSCRFPALLTHLRSFVTLTQKASESQMSTSRNSPSFVLKQ